MEDREKSEQEMVQYLLGQLSAEEQLRIESSYFAEPARFTQLQAVENDLIEGYVCSKLSVADRARFEEHYLTSPNRREQVEFFQTLVQVLSLESDPSLLASPVQAPVRPSPLKKNADADPESSWWQSLLALFHGPRLVLGASFAAALLLMIGGGIWQLGIRQSPGEVAKTEGTGSPIPQNGTSGQNEPNEQSRRSDLASNATQPGPNDQTDRATGQANDRDRDQANGRSDREREAVRPKSESAPVPPKAAPATISFTWTIPGLRDFNTNGNIPRNLRIPSGTELVQLNFKPSADAGYSRYRVTLKTLDDQDVWSRNDLKTSRSKSNPVLALIVPVKEFQNGSYSVVVSADNKRGESINIAEFHIEVSGVENR